jgi:hypothetical protein
MEVLLVSKNNLIFYLWGEVVYDDVVGGDRHRTRFVYRIIVYGGDPLKGWNQATNSLSWQSYLHGAQNCADEDCGEC